MIPGVAAVFVLGAFVLPIALSANAGASPTDAPTTTLSAMVSTTATASTTSTSSTTSVPASTTTTASTTTSTTEIPTSTTVSPPVTDQGVVAIGESADTIFVEGSIDAQARGAVLPQTGSSPMPLWVTGVACVVSGAFALTFKRRRQLR